MKKIAVLLLVFLSIMAGVAMVASAAEGVSSEWVPQTMSNTAANYWTKARMMNAKPYPIPKEQGTLAPADSPQEQTSGEPGLDKGGLPGQSSALFSDDATDAVDPSGGSDAAMGSSSGIMPMANGYDYPPPHDTFAVSTALYGTAASTSPYRTVGKVFFTKATGGNFVCSGSSIGGRAVLTAGHCVSDGAGHWHKNWIFVPAYRNGAAPYGRWSAFWKSTSTSWHTQKKFDRDVGFAAVNDIGGVKLSAKVGWLGFAWNWSRVQHWNMFGYPNAAPFNGQWLYTTQASYSNHDTSKVPNTTGIGTTQTPGCSGGPWIWKFGNGNYANGVNSYVYTTPAQPLRIYSPYFDTWVKTSLKDPAVLK